MLTSAVIIYFFTVQRNLKLSVQCVIKYLENRKISLDTICIYLTETCEIWYHDVDWTEVNHLKMAKTYRAQLRNIYLDYNIN